MMDIVSKQRHGAGEGLQPVELGDHGLLSQIFFPKPVVLIGTSGPSGQANLAPYSQVFPQVSQGRIALQLVCRATSNIAANIERSRRVTLSFIPDDAILLANARLLAIPGTTAEKMARNHFTLVEADGAPPHVAEAVQVIEATWTGEDVQASGDNDRCFVLTVDRLLMAPHWQSLLESGQGTPSMPIDFGLRRPGSAWLSRPHRQSYKPRLRPRFESQVPLSPDEVVARFERGLSDPTGPVRGSVRGHHIQLGMAEELRHVGSPQMELEVFPEGAHSRIQGRIGPNPHVWTLFLGLHAVVAFFGLGGTFFGVSQWLMDAAPWGLASLPVALGLHLFIAGAAFIGQGLGADQTYQMRTFMDDLMTSTSPTRVD